MIGGIPGSASGALAALKKNAVPMGCAIATPLTAFCCAAAKQEMDKFSINSDNHLKLAGLFLGSIMGSTLTFMLFVHLLISRARHPQQVENVA